MAKYIVEMQMDKQEKFYFIRENESGDIVYLHWLYDFCVEEEIDDLEV